MKIKVYMVSIHTFHFDIFETLLHFKILSHRKDKTFDLFDG